MSDRDRLRDLPSVDRLATAVARAELQARREELLTGAAAGDDTAVDLVARARARLRPHLRRILNATGVVVHTNLGRAPLAVEARAAVAAAADGYSNLELDLATGARGSRQAHVEELLRELTGAQAAIAVNNCAAAVLLACAALAGGRDTVVSRGQLIEIGGGFRIPEILEVAGTRLVEVGTTNRTRRADYEAALATGGERIAAILRAHPSNFRTVGFVAEVEIEDLCDLGAAVIDDVGSGVLTDDLELLAGEPPVRRSVRAGAALTAFSAARRRGCWSVRARRSRLAAAIRSRARYGSTSCRSPHSRRRSPFIATRRQRAARCRCWRCSKPTTRPCAGAQTSSRPRPAVTSSRRRRASAAVRCRCSSCRGRRSRSTPARQAQPRSRQTCEPAIRRLSAASMTAGCCSIRER
jgi:L-seryl-tRNA(Ser) seleniumtransferase